MTVNATLFENWSRLASVVRERIELRMVESDGGLPTAEIERMVGEIVPAVDLAISCGLQERAIPRQQQQQGES